MGGLEANIEVYRNSPVNGIPIKQYRPLIFRDGVEEEFPQPDAPLPPIQLRSEDMHLLESKGAGRHSYNSLVNSPKGGPKGRKSGKGGRKSGKGSQNSPRT